MVEERPVRDFMTPNLVTVTPDAESRDAVKILLDHRISAAPVVDDEGQLVGMLSEKDCLPALVEATRHPGSVGPVLEYMSTTLASVPDSMSLDDVAAKFMEESRKRYPVLNGDGVLAGQISRSDVLRAMENFWEDNK